MGLVFVVVLIAPAMATVNFTTMPYGGTKISNGTYWIAWSPVGPYVVGDRFFFNGTTNLSAGTQLDYLFAADSSGQCHKKICEGPIDVVTGIATVESGTTGSPNTLSILIDTTGFKSDNYSFLFSMVSSNESVEYDAFSGPRFVGLSNISLSPPPTQNATPSLVGMTPAVPTKSPVPLIVTVGALLGGMGIVLMIKRKNFCNINEMKK